MGCGGPLFHGWVRDSPWGWVASGPLEHSIDGGVASCGEVRPVEDALVMRRLLEYARTWDLLVISHAEEPALAKGGLMNEGLYASIELWPNMMILKERKMSSWRFIL